jgi:hypothetical protein
VALEYTIGARVNSRSIGPVRTRRNARGGGARDRIRRGRTADLGDHRRSALVRSAFFVSRHAYVLAQWSARIAAVAIGVTIVLVARPRIGHIVARNPERALHVSVACVLALGASELILRQLHVRVGVEEGPGREPRRRRDPRLGWIFAPGRVGHRTEGGRVIEYAFDPAGYRVRRIDEPVDPERPTIVFTGESMIVGEGLPWEETVPAQVGAILGAQTANIAVSGFASDQAYLRLQAELPRFRRPVAVISVFTPTIFDRNMDDDRPHLGPGLTWQPEVARWRLVAMTKVLVRYRKPDTIQRGIAITREVLLATVDAARARGAVPLIVVPQFVPEQPDERELRRRILDDSNLPLVRVELDGSWRIPGDGHPDARAARAIATAIATRLRNH